MRISQRAYVIAATGTFAAAGLGLAIGPALADTATSTPSATASASASSSQDATRTDKRESRIKGELAGLVKDGTITQAQADKVAATLAASDKGKGTHSGKHGRHQVQDAAFTAAAKTLNLGEDALKTKLRSSTLGKAADEAGVSRATLVDAMVKAASAEMDKEVTAGTLTQSQADTMKSGLKTRITDSLDRQMGHGRHGH